MNYTKALEKEFLKEVEPIAPLDNSDCSGIDLESVEINSNNHDLFLQALPELFETNNQRFIMSHFLWGNENLDKLIHYLRLYDLLSRIYTVKTKSIPSPTQVIRAIKDIEKNEKLNEIFGKYIEEGRYPYFQNLPTPIGNH